MSVHVSPDFSSSDLNIFSLGQLWKLTDEMKLVNKNGSWSHQEKIWNMPAEGSCGHIEDQASGEVLGLWNDSTDLGSMVGLEPKDRPLTDEQLWVRGLADGNGWFRFKNPISGRVLSVQTFSSATIAGNKFFF